MYPYSMTRHNDIRQQLSGQSIGLLNQADKKVKIIQVLATQFKGKITELQVATALLQKGYTVSQPLIDTRYDFLLEYKNQFLKIQVKTSHIIGDNEAIEFSTCNTHINTQKIISKTYKGQIDYFATYYNNQCYIIPIEDCGSRTKKLRIAPTKNHQIKGISFLKDYTLEKILPND